MLAVPVGTRLAADAGGCGLPESRSSLPPSAVTGPNFESEPLVSHAAECLALVIVWSAREPQRVGEVALVTPDEPVWILGRAPALAGSIEVQRSARTPNGSRHTPSDLKGRPLGFFRQRPQGALDSGDIDNANCELGGEAISRRQIALVPSATGIALHNIGQCELFVNGAPTKEATIRQGDTLYLKNQLLLYCTHRPLHFPALKAYPLARIGHFGQPDHDGMVGETPQMWKLRDRLAACARTNHHVLVVGESGSGKELAAQSVHHLSARAGRKLIADNIAAIPPGLAAALLFGNKRNFPNPGMEERIGLIGAANGSSLFLDEIGDMPEAVQPMFLRVTERNGDFFRLGEENKLQRSDFRLIGATNRPENMRYELKRRFQREIRVPGLNSRKEDIPLLIQHLLKMQAQNDDMDAARFIEHGHAQVHPLLVEQLIHHSYRTHVSEIAFLLGQAMADSPHDVVRPLGSGLRIELLQPSERSQGSTRKTTRPLPSIGEVRQALLDHNGHLLRTASALNISRHQLNRMIARESIPIPRSRRTLRDAPGGE